MAKRSAPEVNAGSMADIAFLLLIFFLVTTTIEVDSGINSKLPPDEPPIEDVRIKQKNIFTVELNKNNQMLVEGDLMEVKDLKAAAIKFIDNGGGQGDDKCTYCKGAKDPASSDNPGKAIISITHSRATDYETFITVYDQLVSAYSELRERLAQKQYNRSFKEMEAAYDDSKSPDFKSEKLKDKIEDIKKKYPRIISKAEPKF
ncbi:biopolymer transport exbD protein [Mesoflavibacter sp. HG96]|uniref:ExbD/TolR family protein n=1 Tax=unclassified Mesoflavibacter TaxID=2630131 RepID=UPI000D10190A|nr:MULTISPECIES: biopolymer transporter ExbD [unclassified Mesoflavibacter]QIJ89205.1 biopolymer transport exbD protein [Mesoflavibacter sp. HG96]QIJ91933.1 biopolymer transport exbD protein [Mesoflavibacter sp. HG37]